MLTEALMRQYDACWDGQRYDEARDRHGTDALTPRQVAEDECLTLSDRIWALATALVHRRPDQAKAIFLGEKRRAAVYSLWDLLTGDLVNDANMRAGIGQLLNALGPDADGWKEAP